MLNDGELDRKLASDRSFNKFGVSRFDIRSNIFGDSPTINAVRVETFNTGTLYNVCV